MNPDFLSADVIVNRLRAAERPSEIVFQYVLDETDGEVALIDALPQPLRWVWAMQVLDGEVCNGGFNQYFFNPSSRWIDDALDGYRHMGMDDYATIVENAARRAINPREMALRRQARTAGTLEAFFETYKDSELGEFDRAYFALPEWEERVGAYIRQHPWVFVLTE